MSTSGILDRYRPLREPSQLTHQPPPYISYHKAYRFEAKGLSNTPVTGIVFKAQPYGVTWEAQVDGTSVRVRSETRAGAVEAALAQLGTPSPGASIS